MNVLYFLSECTLYILQFFVTIFHGVFRFMFSGFSLAFHIIVVAALIILNFYSLLYNINHFQSYSFSLFQFMQDKSFKSEDDLFKLFFKHKVFFAQGSVFYSKEPGWFRIIFTQNLEILQVGTYD